MTYLSLAMPHISAMRAIIWVIGSGIMTAPSWAATSEPPAWVEARVADASDRTYERTAVWCT